MSDKLTREQLEALNFFAMRDLARQLGCKNATAQKKDALIEFVLSKQSEPAVQGTEGEESATADEKRGRGRPTKARTVASQDEAQPAVQPAVQPTRFPEGESDNRPYGNGNGNGAGRQQFDKYRKNPAFGAFAEPAPSEAVDPNAPLERRSGILEICPDGFGFLRAENCQQGDKDAHIIANKIRKYGLRKGDFVVATVRKVADNRPMSVDEVESVNGFPPSEALNRKNFATLTPIYPDRRLRLEVDGIKNDTAIRCIDLVAPIGKGQRGMIVSPPKAGKTTLLKKIANSISTNHPEIHLIVLLIDERPEEVTDMQRSTKGEVIYSTFDEYPEHHVKAVEMVLERAKRLVEIGKDVVILMDSLTRLSRAYNAVVESSGKTLSGGIDPAAMIGPKKFFGAARNIEFGGSLTIIATALVDTGSRMDEVVYEEFKGTGNMEIHLDRRLSEKRIFPAIDLNRSSTRREELLLSQRELEGIWAVRKMLSAGDVQEAAENLIGMMLKTSTNKDFVDLLSLQIAKLQKEGYKFS
ncbi:MAG: transcription termination factor Rho [Firmicutes bacterium]|nr:transcription termination factor Rho [Bacillota bacterium]